MMPGRLNEEKGIILPIVLILTLILMITGLVFVSLGVQENRLVQREIKKRRAFYLAEAGIETAIWQFNCGDQPWLPWSAPWTEDGNGNPTRTETLYAPQGSSAGDYEVTVSDKDASNPLIESTGYVPSKGAEGRVEKTVCVTLEKGHDAMFGYAIASAAGIIIENPGTVITGSCYAVGDIIIDEATVNGNAEATETVSVTNEGTVTGTITEGADELPFPEFDSSYYQYNASSITNGDLAINGVDPYAVDGILYVTGNVTISNSTLVGPGSIVAEGKINVQQNSLVGTSIDTGVSLVSAYESTLEDDIAIKLEEGIAENPSEVWGELWSPNGEIKIEMNSLIYGSAVSGGRHKIETGSGVIYYTQFDDEDFYSYVARPTYLVQNWQEE
ncbi:hypothetical protein CEE34_04805 [Candidatus Aerophobetes bacterium Ae_b3a]|nr:MAG: hypothetical protein CEE34_04805 [Candidatus Aerophobetes bacterium Ae_b3a]